MAKKVASAISTLKISQSTADVPEIADKAELQEVVDALAEDSEDLTEMIRENQNEEAIEVLEEIQIVTEAMLQHLRK